MHIRTKESLFRSTVAVVAGSSLLALTGIVLFFMLGCEFFISYRLIVRGKGERTHE